MTSLNAVLSPAKGETSLSRQESAQLYDYEKAIERGLDTFVEVGQALASIRDGRLYRYRYRTFEDYVRERWKMSVRHAHRLVEGAEIAANLLPPPPAPDNSSKVTNWSPPRNESQVRPLQGLPASGQQAVWQEAVKAAPAGQVTAREVKQARARLEGAERVIEVDMARVDGGDIDKTNCHQALAATAQTPELIVHIERAFEFEHKFWVVSVGHFGGSPPDHAVVTHEAHELLIPALYRGPVKPAFAEGRLVSFHGTVFRLGPKVLFRAEGQSVRGRAPELKLELQQPPKEKDRRTELSLSASVLVRDAIKLQELSQDCVSTKQLLHLSIALTHLKNFRASIDQAVDPKKKAAEYSQRENSKALSAAGRKRVLLAAAARWIRAKHKPKSAAAPDPDLHILCRTNQSGLKTFDTGGGWSNDPLKAKTFPNATAAKFAARQAWDKPMKLSAALRLAK